MNYIQKIYSGRINRKIYALGLISWLLVASLIGVILNVVKSYDVAIANTDSPFSWFIAILGFIFIFFLFSIPVRRLHDIGKSGLFSLFLFIPIVNLMLLFILLLFKGKPTENKYGEIPQKENIFKAILKIA